MLMQSFQIFFIRELDNGIILVQRYRLGCREEAAKCAKEDTAYKKQIRIHRTEVERKRPKLTD